jgi:hypothetical protein
MPSQHLTNRKICAFLLVKHIQPVGSTISYKLTKNQVQENNTIIKKKNFQTVHTFGVGDTEEGTGEDKYFSFTE